MSSKHAQVHAARPGSAPAAADHAYAAMHAGFVWHVPERFNLAEVCLHRWARETPDAVAIIHERENGVRADISYGVMQRKARRLSNALAALGVAAGDRVAVIMPQRPQTATALLAIVQMGAIAVPLSTLFGPEALQSRLADSGAKVAIVDELSAATVKSLRGSLPALQTVMGVGKAEGRADASWTDALADARPGFQTADTHADDPAFLIYTSGTTGPAKGALVPHRAMIGNLSGFVASQNWFLPGGGPFWSPADWAWTGGLWDALLPTLYFGRTIVAASGRFDAVQALKLMERHKVSHTFLFPTAIKAMMRVAPQARTTHPGLRLQAIMSAGEAVGEAVFAWCREQLGVVVNEMFGQTEMNYVVGNCGRHASADGTLGLGWPARPGSMGRPYPGHRVAVIDDEGNECPRGTIGDVAVHPRDVHGDRDPVFFLGYWNNEAATQAKFTGEPFESWCRTGDRAAMDADGYLWYAGRSDDQFKTSGYRVGPAEIEGCLARHPAVAQVAVVPKPDAERGAVVKAFIIAAAGVAPTPALVEELQQLVRSRLAPYETPKEIEFVDALPMTTTGKLQRNVLRQLEVDRAKAAAAAALPPAEAGPRAQAAANDDDLSEYALREPIPDDEEELADEEE
jgi:acetyl-CoA synthetase